MNNIEIPFGDAGIDRWVVVGLDPSLSRTGFAVLNVGYVVDGVADRGATTATWQKVGSVKPQNSSDPIWVRQKLIALHLRSLVEECGFSESGLIVCSEYATPGEDRLVALSRIISTTLYDERLHDRFKQVRCLFVNASTLRSLMCLTKKGDKNKQENIARAKEYLPEDRYLSLDTDACDAVLLSIMGRYTASLLMGLPEEVPDKFLDKLCSTKEIIKGKGDRAKRLRVGILQRPEYWCEYKPSIYTIAIKDASVASSRLQKREVVI